MTQSPAATTDRQPSRGIGWMTAATGLHYQNRDDFACADFIAGTNVAGMFTRSTLPAAPVLWCQQALKSGTARMLLVNAGNANAFTGSAGMVALRQLTAAAAQSRHCPETDIFIASTGVIGNPLDPRPLIAALPSNSIIPEADSRAWNAAANAIITTDTIGKYHTANATLDGHPVALDAIAKGSGMMAPNMATMLVFIATDAAISAPALQHILTNNIADSFNAISIDSDTSTNDTILVFATGAAQPHTIPIDNPDDPRLEDWRNAFDGLMKTVALALLRDGEGVKKLIHVTLCGATDHATAHHIARSIIDSPLVKSGFSGARANWGRLIMAMGKSGVELDPQRIDIRIGGILVATNGGPALDHDAAALAEHCCKPDLDIAISIGDGPGRACLHGCDLTADYVHINADYLT